MAIRVDFGELKSPYTTPDGVLLAEASLCRAGVLNYKRADGSVRREFRPPEENEKAIGEMGLLPVTIEHPSVGLLTADNAGKFRKGMTLQNLKLGRGGFVRADIAVWDSEAQELVRSGDKSEVSLGYRCDIDPTPGVWVDSEGVSHPYDAIQRRIVPNHCALTSKGRAGSEVRVYLDSIADEEDIAVMEDSLTNLAQPRHDAGCGCATCKGEKKKMDGEGMKEKGKKVVIKLGDDDMSEEYMVDDSMAGAIRKKLDGYKMKMDSLTSDLASKEETIAELQARIEELEAIALENEGHYDSLRSEYEELVSRVDSEDPDEEDEEDDEDDTEEEAIDLEALIQEAIEQRKAAFENVQELLPEGEEFDATLTPAQWNEKALELAGVGMDSEELDEATIAGIIKGLKLANTRTDSLRDRLNKNYRADSSVVRSDAEAARERMIAEQREMANRPLREILRGMN